MRSEGLFLNFSMFVIRNDQSTSKGLTNIVVESSIGVSKRLSVVSWSLYNVLYKITKS